jgi:hypothetical protein
MAKRLGKDWKPEVWENLGWFSAASNGVLKVYDHGDNYWATTLDPGTAPAQRYATCETPEEAVAAVKTLLEQDLKTLRVAIHKLQQAR